MKLLEKVQHHIFLKSCVYWLHSKWFIVACIGLQISLHC